MWAVFDRRPGFGWAGLVLLAASFVWGCGGAGTELGAVQAVGRATDAEASPLTGTGEATPPSADRIRRGGDGPASILEFGLFGPVVPTLEGEGYYQGDCRFENDPYETCL